jgi:uncharacterized membrane-anchored protein
MRISFAACVFAAWVVAGSAVAAVAPQALTPQQQAQLAKYKKIAAGLHPRFGDVPVAVAGATLHLGRDYYFLSADEARSVLVDAWGNPPDAVPNVQGMIFPAGKSFASDSWAAIVSYKDSGHVDDADAKTTDYGAMLQQAHDSEADINQARKDKGFATMHLVGWAQPPYYDQAHHTLVWARDIRFGDLSQDTLNYDLRALGRGGVMSMNIVSTMARLGEVRMAAAKLQNIGTFNNGARYEDYKAGSDKLAEYGVGGLVAAGVGVVLAQKLGLLAVVLLFAKKFIAVILAGFAAVGAWFRRRLSRKAAAAAAPSSPVPPEPPVSSANS